MQKRIQITSICILTAICSMIASASEGWLTDFDQAKKQAQEKKLPILADFTGSDWCGWCIRLKKEVFHQDAFKNYAKDNLILLEIDFPQRKQQPPELKEKNKQLAKEFEVRGFPTIILLDAEGNELARTGYRPGGSEVYIEHLKELLNDKD